MCLFYANECLLLLQQSKTMKNTVIYIMPSPLRLTGNLIIVSWYNTDYNKYCPEYKLTYTLAFLS